MEHHWKNEQEARQEILSAVSAYYHEYKENKKLFQPGDRVTYAARVFDEKEMCSLVDSALDTVNGEVRLTDTIGDLGTSSFYPPHHSNTDRIMRDTFWVGGYPGMTDEMLDYMAQTIIEAVRL